MYQVCAINEKASENMLSNIPTFAPFILIEVKDMDHYIKLCKIFILDLQNALPDCSVRIRCNEIGYFKRMISICVRNTFSAN